MVKQQARKKHLNEQGEGRVRWRPQETAKVSARKQPMEERNSHRRATARAWVQGSGDRDRTPSTRSGDTRTLGLHQPVIYKSLRNLGLEKPFRVMDSGWQVPGIRVGSYPRPPFADMAPRI